MTIQEIIQGCIRRSNDVTLKSLGEENLALHSIEEWIDELKNEGEYITDANELLLYLGEIEYELKEKKNSHATAVEIAVDIIKHIIKIQTVSF